MIRNRKSLISMVSVLALLAVLPVSNVFAQSGFYVGGNIGRAALDLDIGGGEGGVFNFDENDIAWKAYGGYSWQLAILEVGVEAGYVDFGSPSTSIEAVTYDLDSDGWNLMGTAGIDIGPIGVFGKVGYIAWDVSGSSFDEVRNSVSDDGSDLGYGIGAKFMLGSLEVRTEFEYYDIEGGSLDMLSAGLVWKF